MESKDRKAETKKEQQPNLPFHEEKDEGLEEDDQASYVEDEDIDEVFELEETEFNENNHHDEAEMEESMEDMDYMSEEEVFGTKGENRTPEHYEDHAQVVFAQHQEPVYAVACHPTLPYVVSGGGDDRSYLWHVANGQVVHVHEKRHTDSVVSVGFNFDGQYYATAGMDHQLFIYETASGKEMASFEASDEILWIDWHPRGNVIVAGTNDGQVWLWNMQTVMHVFHGAHLGPVHCGQFTPNGKHVVSGGEEGSFVVWDPHTAQPLFKYTTSDQRWLSDAVTALRVHPTQPLALVGARNGQVKLVHLQQEQLLASFDSHSLSIECIRFSPATSALAAVCSVDGTVSILDLQHTRVRSVLSHPDAVTGLAFPTEKCLVTVCVDGQVRVFEPWSAHTLYTLSGHTLPILTLDASDTHIVTGSDDGACRVFPLPTV